MALSVTSGAGGVLDISGTSAEFPPPFVPPNQSTFDVEDLGTLYRWEAIQNKWLDVTEVQSDVTSGVFDVTKSHGGSVSIGNAIAGGGTDNYARLQALIDYVPNYAALYFPEWTGYLCNGTLDFGNKRLRVYGDNPGAAAFGIFSGGSVLYGTVNGPLMKTGTVLQSGNIIETLGFRNLHATGTGVKVTGVGAVVRDVSIAAFIAIDASFNNFTLGIEDSVLRPAVAYAIGSIGVLANSGGDASIRSCDIVHFDHGVRAFGPGMNITGCRVEVNNVGFMLGMDGTGATSNLSKSVIAGNSFEANDTAIQIKGMTTSLLAAMGIQGSVNSPTGQSQYGIVYESGSQNEFNGIGTSGSFSKVAVRIKVAGKGLWKNSTAVNTFSGAQLWDVQTNLVDVGFENCNYTERPDDVAGANIDYRRGVVTQSVRGIDLLNAGLEGRNVRGKAVAVTQTATSVAIAFTGAHNSGQPIINTIAAQAGGTLAAATYYYICTVVTAHGESGSQNEQSVVVGGANGTVHLTFFGFTADGWKRRVYKGTATGVYDGYFELPLNSSAAFDDTGQAFTGLKSPNGTGQDGETSMLEPDADYAVIVTPNWGTTSWVTAKATTGFTINFGTAAPASATVDWFIVR